jgi:pimeloyl-ACP methyl ester carboxylesterase
MGFLLGLVIGLLIGGILGVFFVLRVSVPRLEQLYVFRPSKDVLRKPSDLGVSFDQCFIDTPDGCRLSAWHLSPENPRASILYFHGSGGNLGIRTEVLVRLYQQGFQVFAVDYRGFGWSTGTPSEEGLYVDVASTVAYFNANFRRFRCPLVYWGRSLGGCFAAAATTEAKPDGLVLETAFPSKASLLDDFPQFRFIRYFSRYKLDTVSFLRGHSFPVLIIHGDQDRTVPMRQAEVLYRQLDGPKEFLRIDGAGHIDIHMVDPERYMQGVLSFVQQLNPVVVH